MFSELSSSAIQPRRGNFGKSLPDFGVNPGKISGANANSPSSRINYYIEEHCRGDAEIEVVNFDGNPEKLRAHL